MKRAGLRWDEEALDAFLADPQKAVPGNLMPYSGLPSASERAYLIAYLKTLGAATP
jgi:cytochrome c